MATDPPETEDPTLGWWNRKTGLVVSYQTAMILLNGEDPNFHQDLFARFPNGSSYIGRHINRYGRLVPEENPSLLGDKNVPLSLRVPTDLSLAQRDEQENRTIDDLDVFKNGPKIDVPLGPEGAVAPTGLSDNEYDKSPIYNDQTATVAQETALPMKDVYSPSGSGLLPDSMPQNISYGEALNVIDNFSYEEKIRLKQRLWAAGFYEEGSLQTGSPPEDATITAKDRAAWKLALTEVGKNVLNKREESRTSLDAVINERIVQNQPIIRNATLEKFNIPSVAVDLNTWAQKNMDRSLTDEEVQQILKITMSSNTNVAMGEVTGSTNGMGSTAGDAAAGGLLVHGGGPDSSAIAYGRQLANLYGLQVEQDFTPRTAAVPNSKFWDGLGIKVAGDTKQLMAMHEWAKSNSGANKLFDNVDFRYDSKTQEPVSLILTFNDGVQKPFLANGVVDASASRDSDIQKFMVSMRNSRSQGAYNAYAWDTQDPLHRGAYGMSDQLWDYYTSRLKIDSSDHSVSAQDAVGRAYIQDKFNKYGNWADVAIGLLAGDDAAERVHENRRNNMEDPTADLNDDIKKSVSQIITLMPNMNGSPRTTAGDPYSQIFGTSGTDLPYISDPFAGSPVDANAAQAKALWTAEKLHRKDIAGSTMISNILQLMSKYDLSQLGAPVGASNE